MSETQLAIWRNSSKGWQQITAAMPADDARAIAERKSAFDEQFGFPPGRYVAAPHGQVPA